MAYEQYASNISQMRKDNPTQFTSDDDAISWGKKYYGWSEGTAAKPASQPTQAEAIQKQQQTPYAGQTGQALSTQIQKQQSSAPASGTSTSPVTGDGKINEANAPASSTPAPAASAPAPRPAPVPINHRDPAYANVNFDTLKPGDAVAGQPGATWTHTGQGWAIIPGGSVAPGQSPGGTPMPGTPPQGPAQWAGVNTALAGAGLPGRPANTQYTPGQLPQYTGGTWTAPAVSVYGGGAWTPQSADVYGGQGWAGGQTEVGSGQGWGGATLAGGPMSQYGGSTFSQYGNINQAPMEGATQAALMNAINGPGPVNPELLKAAAKDDSTAMMKQLGSQSADAMAARGLSGGGADAAAQSRIQEQGVSDLLKNYRGIEIDAATRNRDALMSALGMADQTMNSQVGRAGQQYQNVLAGQGLQAADTQAAINSRNAANQFDFNKSLAQAGISKDVWESGNTAAQQRIANQAQNLDFSKDAWTSGLAGQAQRNAQQLANQNLGYQGWQSGLAANQQQMTGQLANAGLSHQGWQSGLSAHDAALKSALAQEGLHSGAAGMNSGNFGDDTKSLLTKMGFDVDKYKADIGKEVGMAGVEADKFGSRMGVLPGLLGILEGARSNDQNTGINWAKILSGGF